MPFFYIDFTDTSIDLEYKYLFLILLIYRNFFINLLQLKILVTV